MSASHPAVERSRFERFLTVLSPAYRPRRYASIERVMPPRGKEYPISPELARLLASLVLVGPITRMLEFGAGVSSLIIATAMRHGGGGAITSVEDAPVYSEQLWKEVRSIQEVDAELVVTRLRLATIGNKNLATYGDTECRIEARGPYDAVLIDGPRSEYGREGILHQAWNALRPGALIIVDDVGRRKEFKAVRSWLTAYPGLFPLYVDLHFGGRGVALLYVSDTEL